jgi:hypothetical protein
MVLHSLALALSLVAIEEPEPVAMVLSVQGDMKLRCMDLIRSGTELRVPSPGGVRLVFLADGHRESLKSCVTVRITEAGGTPAEAVRREPDPRRRSQLEGLRKLAPSSRAGVSRIRDVDAPPVPASPIDASIVLSDRPGFAWTSAQDAGECDIQLFRGETDRNESLVWTMHTAKPNVEYPKDRRPLIRGETYMWRVSTLKRDIVAKGTFTVATGEEARAFESIQRMSRSPETSDRLLAAMLFEAGQVYDESHRLFDSLAKELPVEPWVLLASARHLARLGRIDEALSRQKKALALARSQR